MVAMLLRSSLVGIMCMCASGFSVRPDKDIAFSIPTDIRLLIGARESPRGQCHFRDVGYEDVGIGKQKD